MVKRLDAGRVYCQATSLMENLYLTPDFYFNFTDIMHWWIHQLQEVVISWDPTRKESLDLPLRAQQLQESTTAIPGASQLQELVGTRSPIVSRQQKVSKVHCTLNFVKYICCVMTGY